MSASEGAIRLGSLLFSLVEPERGHGRAFHRWYERDHFYSGMMSGPDLFAGRRWVATRALKKLRYPADSPLVDPLDAGSYAVTYWILEGRCRNLAIEQGLVMSAVGDMLIIAPPLVITRSEVDELVGIADRVLTEIA